MQLNISYKDGSRRIINLTKDFFIKVPENELKEKAITIALSTGFPHTICLEKEGKIIFDKTIEKNVPFEKRPVIQMTPKTKAKYIANLKDLKQRTKNQRLRVIFPVRA